MKNKTALRLVRGHLGLGEAEAVVWAEEINADLLLVDDLKARQFAILAGLRIGGTIMVLTDLSAQGKARAIAGIGCTAIELA